MSKNKEAGPELFKGSSNEKQQPLLTPVSDEQWQAIADNDSAYDGQFFYAVKTTGIFCRPSCKSKVPIRENTCMFLTAEEALNAYFRPCKRCKPTGGRLPDEEWIDLVTTYIDSHYQESLSLDTLAQLSHGSPYHLQRIFKKVKGITPVYYIQQLRINAAKAMLRESNLPITEIAALVGLPNTSYFITLFKQKTGQTPETYRKSRK